MPAFLERMPLHKMRLIAVVFVFTSALILYFLTLAPTVTFVDSGELLVVSHGLGVAHPPGFPLYVLLAHMASLTPFGSVAVRIHLASALFGALAAAMMTLLVAEPMLSSPADRKNKRAQKDQPNLPFAANVLGPALVAGLLFAFSRTLWAYATVAEVYTLNSLLIVTILWLMFVWRRKFDARAPVYRELYIAAFLFGLAMGVHHVTVLFFLPSLAALVLTTAKLRFFISRNFLFAALIAVAGLSIYVYLPIAASRSPLINWGEPQTMDAIWQHISGKQYQVLFKFDPARLADHLWFLLREWGAFGLPAVLALATAGLVDLFRRDKAVVAFLAIVIAIDILYISLYLIADDRDAYYLPTFISLTIGAAYGTRWIIHKAKGGTATSLITPSRVAAALLLVPIIALASNLGYNDRHNFHVAHDYVDNINMSVEPSGMVLTTDWQPYSPSLYVREIDGQRRDIVFIDVNLLRQAWYYSYLEKAYPETMARSRDKFNALLQDLRAWDRDPAVYDQSPALKQRATARLQDLVLTLMTERLKAGSVYVTVDLADTSGGKEVGFKKMLQERFELVPQGLVFRVFDKGSALDLPQPPINIHGLNDGTIKYGDDDPVKRSVIPAYLNMLTNDGIYLASRGIHDKATACYQQALALDPAFEPAKKGLAASQAATKK